MTIDKDAIQKINSNKKLQKPFFEITDEYLKHVTYRILGHYEEEYEEGNILCKLDNITITRLEEEKTSSESDEYYIKFKVYYTYHQCNGSWNLCGIDDNDYDESDTCSDSFIFDYDPFNHSRAEFEDDLFEKLECELEKEGF